MKTGSKFILVLIVTVLVSAGVSYFTVNKVESVVNRGALTMLKNDSLSNNVRIVNVNASSALETDFTIAASQSVNSVVHIAAKSMKTVRSRDIDIFEYFFGNGGGRDKTYQQPQVGYGSGVIISSDGYIVTNNHVIEGANEITVVLNNKKTYNATVVGADPNTDIALIKIDADSLPVMPVGNSDDLKIGQWVLAVGNPLNLSSTVTAGIVSAKARNLGLIASEHHSNPNNNLSIESFIQTDAAVNPGNSGGALVNLKGELVGINTAIVSQTGSYSGYSFAVPSNIVSRVVNDLKTFGVVQRAFLGVSLYDITSELAKKENIKVQDGVYIAGVEDMSAAKEAGIEKGDIVLSVNGVKVNKASELQEQIIKYHPGDVVSLKIKREDDIKYIKVTLRNRQGGLGEVKKIDIDVLGAKYKPVSEKMKKRLNIDYGVQVDDLKNGKLKRAGIKEGFIILKINDTKIDNVNRIQSIIEDTQNEKSFEERGLFIIGIYPSGKVAYYAVNLSE